MTWFAQRSDTSEFRKRFRWIALAMTLVFLGLIGRLFQLQLLEGEEHAAIARENIIRRITLATTRGIIRDRNGNVLAASRPSYDVYVVPERLDMDVTWPRLAEYLALNVEERAELEEKLTRLRAHDKKKQQQILLKEDISRDAVALLETHRSELNPGKYTGVRVSYVPVRYYPYGEIGAHVLGYMAEVSAEKLTRLRSAGYIEGDRLGATGVERAWESYLRGTRGWQKVIVDARGRRRQGGEEIIGEDRQEDPIPGRDLRLTLDAELQKAVHRAMRGELAGGVALVDVRSGRILALYSKPSYDPNALSGGSGKEVIRKSFRRLFSDPLKPALDKTVSGAYPPGSTFKPFTALAALEKGLINERLASQCRGFLTFGNRSFRCTHVHGATALHKAIAESCNVYFFRLASEYQVGMDIISELGKAYGFGAKTGLGINAEASGRMPTRAWMTLRNKGQYRLGFTLNAAIGQGATTVSVLQLALAYAALANGGTLYQPQLVKAVETSGGTVVQEFSPRVRRQLDVSPENLAMVQRALDAGVNTSGGTAYNARIEGVELAGKTGTAQVTRRVVRGVEAERVWYFNREHAWFAGYSPINSPEVAIVVLVEHGGAGGKHAAPVAFEVIKAYQELRAELSQRSKKDGDAPGGARPGGTRPGGRR